MEKLVKEQSLNSSFLPAIGSNQTLLTEKKSANGPATFRSDRPILIVSSTSWTADEDFQLLLTAAKQYDDLAKLENTGKATSTGKGKADAFPKLLFVITGKGPLKQHYEEVISKMDLENVVFVTSWLSPENYPRLLGMLPILHFLPAEKWRACFFFVYDSLTDGREMILYILAALIRIGRLGSFITHLCLWGGSAHEGRRHVWLWSPRLCIQLPRAS